jgi:hypothetical protein
MTLSADARAWLAAQAVPEPPPAPVAMRDEVNVSAVWRLNKARLVAPLSTCGWAHALPLVDEPATLAAADPAEPVARIEFTAEPVPHPHRRAVTGLHVTGRLRDATVDLGVTWL